MSPMTVVPLTRAELTRRGVIGASSAPVRIIHLGVGHFFRAHQAWYTARAADASDWGIAAFAGRNRAAVDGLDRQDGLYCVVERAASGDTVDIVTSIAHALAGDDVEQLVAFAIDPAVAIVTLTVTESGYRLRPDGAPNLEDPGVGADLADLAGGAPAVRTVLGRLVTILAARRSADAGPIAVVSCDNIPHNGRFVERGVREFATFVDPALDAWIAANVSFVDTSVDRITPHGVDTPLAVTDAGWIDEAAVVTEPFADWVLAGDFPAGRPAWETAGARFVDDIEPWENRKLWLLNGAHTLLTVAGLPRGLSTVDEAIADPECRALVERYWEEAVACLPPGTEHVDYRAQLLDRFANPRIVHRLEQIAADTTVKVQFRFAPVAERRLSEGWDLTASARAFAAWVDWSRTSDPSADSRAEAVRAAHASPDPVASLIGLVSSTLALSPSFVDAVRASLA